MTFESTWMTLHYWQDDKGPRNRTWLRGPLNCCVG